MSYSPQLFQKKLQEALSDIASCQSVLVGLSGGLDSVVLLHGLTELRDRSDISFQIRAVHVNHQLQDQAANWQQYCADLCKEWRVDFDSREVQVEQGANLENVAREARYRAFQEMMKANEILLLAHHRDDQMETMLLRLMRGAGSRGLSGIPRYRRLEEGFLFRPLLDFDRQELMLYAQEQELQWIEDDSNQNQRFDRNYCRHRLLPLIESRWPGYRESWSKTAVLASESEALTRELAAIDLDFAATDSPFKLKLDCLLSLSEPRRRNALRHWLSNLGVPELGWNKLQQLSAEVLQGKSNSQFVAPTYQIRRYRNELHAVRKNELDHHAWTNPADLSWNPRECVEFQLPNNGSLSSCLSEAEGLLLASSEKLTIRYRQGGETCRLFGRPSKSLKKILQEAKIEPWLRDRIPLLYQGDSLVCIPGVGVSAECKAGSGESGFIVHWSRPDLNIDA